MADEERKALVERLRLSAKEDDYAECRYRWGQAADQIEADGQRIAELEREVVRQMGWKTKVQNELEEAEDRIAELEAALREMFEVVCGETGFAQAVRAESGLAYPWPALDLAEAKARAALGEKHD